jgi:hypothetical protein
MNKITAKPSIGSHLVNPVNHVRRFVANDNTQAESPNHFLIHQARALIAIA